MNRQKMKKKLILLLPYIILGLVCTNLGEAWRMAEGADFGNKLVSCFDVQTVCHKSSSGDIVVRSFWPFCFGVTAWITKITRAHIGFVLYSACENCCCT